MSPHHRAPLALLLRPDLANAVQLEWAVFLAASGRRDLLILQREEDSEDRVEEVALDVSEAGDTPVIVREVVQVIENSDRVRAGAREGGDAEDETAAETHVVHVRLRRVHHTSLPALRRLVLAELRDHEVEQLTAVFQRLDDGADADMVKERRLFLRYIPCEVVVCQGFESRRPPSRFLVPVADASHGRAALRLGQDLAASAGGTLTALQVNPQVGALAEQVGERRLDRTLHKALGDDRSHVEPRVVVDDQRQRAIRRVWDEGKHDLIVTSAPQVPIDHTAGLRFGKGVPVVTVSPGSPHVGRLREMFEDTITRFVPQIEREDRVALVDRFQSSAAWNFDFIILMVLSTIIAAVGLMQNSGAVVIGAMLVAPLMTPLLGLGLGIEQGNAALARLSLGSLVRGVGVSLLVGFLVGFGTPGFEEPTREMLARGGPGVLDIFVAFVAGVAAAYASSRPSLIAALPGVAIAAALVPPVATSGLALALGEFRLAIGALLLFAINMVTIVLATMTSLWAVGIRNPGKRAHWLQWVGVLIIVSVMGLGLYLGLHETETELTEQVPPGLVDAIREELGTDYYLDGVAVAYDELGAQLHVSVVGREPAPEELASRVRSVAGDHYDHSVRIRLLTRIAIDVGAGAEEGGTEK